MADRETTVRDGGTILVEPPSAASERPPATAGRCSSVPGLDRAVEVVTTELDATPNTIRALTQLLSADERRRMSRLAFDSDRRRFAIARGTLRELLAARLGADAASITFDYGPRGKPALGAAFADSGVRFNVAHTADVAVFAFADGREVGVDVEAFRAIPDADDVAAHFFSEAENAAYRRLAVTERLAGFYNCWTRKEAFIKAQGDGLHFPLRDFDVSFAPGEDARILRVGTTPGELCGWFMQSFVAAPGVPGAVVVSTSSRRGE
ncbi:MAG TPA: 4'-phosphopantetheinyl transferase superfamily protein [Gemmatimonadaceae bacterium]|nr:4'-phosphopantetheinyl transferase superfamily protein [Gemmatimonadaceae bacterium]